MTDIHSHVLPNVDDGSRSIAMSRRMLGQYLEQGFHNVICTPHQNKELRRAQALKGVFADFCDAVSDLQINLYLGAEIYYYDDMLRDLQRGELLTLNGSQYVLVEFSTRQETDIAEVVYDLSVAGYIPVVAHIERYFYLNRNDYFRIKENGGLIQINSQIFKRDRQKKTGKFLCKNGLVDFIATDCHDDEIRKVDFQSVCKYVEKKYPAMYEKVLPNNADVGRILQKEVL